MDKTPSQPPLMPDVVRRVTVAELQAMLASLEPHDELAPNQVGNLMVIRANAYIGYVDLGYEKAVRLDA